MADQFDGRGGSYVIEGGDRRLVHNTQDHPDGNRAREALKKEADSLSQADAHSLEKHQEIEDDDPVIYT